MDDTANDVSKPPALEAYQRWAMALEIALQFVTGVGIVALLVLMANLDRLLAADESELLVRVRLLKGVISLAMPLIILVFLTGLRHGLTRMLARQNADAEMVKSSRYIWLTVIVFVILILAVDVNIIIESLSDINFQ